MPFASVEPHFDSLSRSWILCNVVTVGQDLVATLSLLSLLCLREVGSRERDSRSMYSAESCVIDLLQDCDTFVRYLLADEVTRFLFSLLHRGRSIGRLAQRMARLGSKADQKMASWPVAVRSPTKSTLTMYTK